MVFIHVSKVHDLHSTLTEVKLNAPITWNLFNLVNDILHMGNFRSAVLSVCAYVESVVF